MVVVDHHVTNEGFGDIALVEPQRLSTAEITLAPPPSHRLVITPTVATALHRTSDTGRFQYSNTRRPSPTPPPSWWPPGPARTDRPAHVPRRRRSGYLAVVSKVTGRAVLEADRRFVWSVLHPEDIEGAGVTRGDVDGLIDLIRLPVESDVAALVKVVDEATVRVSLRSRGRVDVGAIAAAMGGGGHHNASGFTFAGSPEDAVAAVRERLPHG